MTLISYLDGPLGGTVRSHEEQPSDSLGALLPLLMLGLVLLVLPVPSVAQTAQLLVQSNVERATVSVDGTEVGETNAEGEVLLDDLSPGPHTVELRKRGYWNASTRVTLEADLTNSVTLQLTARDRRSGAGVLVRTNVSEATVLLDGLPSAETGLEGQAYLSNVQVGEHQLVVQKEGYESASRTITIAEDELDKNIELRLSANTPAPTAETDEPMPSADTVASAAMSTSGKLIVSTNVGEANVYLDDSLQGQTKSTGNLVLDADSGRHQVTIEKEGFGEVQKTAQLRAGGLKTVEATLEQDTFLPFSQDVLTILLAGVLASVVGALAVVVIFYVRGGGDFWTESPPDAFDRYRLLDVFETGGITSTHLADDPVEDKQVVLRLLDEAYSGDPEVVQAFLQLGQRLTKVTETHPDAPVINAYRYGREKDWGQGRPFIALEYVQGERLSTYLRENGVLKVSHALVIIQQVCEGLQAAHSNQLWHQNVTPENVIVTRTQPRVEVKLVNFRVGKQHVVQKWTAEDEPPQDAAFMAPEQCRKDAVDGSADIYSAGILFHVLVTGTTPFQNDNPSEVMEMHETAPRPQLPDEIPSYVEPLFKRMLNKDPEDRPDASNIVAIIDLMEATT